MSYEQLRSCADFIEANMEFARKRAWDLHKNFCKAKETCVQACEQITRPPNKTTQEQVVASRSDCEHEDREFMMDSGASLHMYERE